LQALPEPVRRYEREHPDELIHFDIKKLGKFRTTGHRITGDRGERTRGAGYEFVHVAIDDASRLAFSEILPDEKKESAIVFLEAAVNYYRGLGIKVSAIMTDNGPTTPQMTEPLTCRCGSTNTIGTARTGA
jgi:hypothetical protein